MKLSLPIFIKLLILHCLTVLCASKNVQQCPASYCDDTRHSCCHPKTGNAAFHVLGPNYNYGSYPQKCNPKSKLSQDFDFFYFVQQWPGSYCDSKHSCCYPKTGKPASDFGIHGLWPNYENRPYPRNCNPSSKFDESQISELTSTLQKEWPSLSCRSSNVYSFWSHEWEKHGTCAESKLRQPEYFQAALNLKQKANLLQALKNAGIKPDDEFYDLDSIEKAIKGAVGFTPRLQCNVDQSKNAQLFQVFLCVDTSGSDFIECPIGAKPPWGICNSTVPIQFPKF